MRIVAAMLVAVIWSSACYADDSYCDNQTIFSSRQEDGSTLSLVLTRTHLSSSPEWKPGTSEPPLSVA